MINIAYDEILLSNRQELFHLVPSAWKHYLPVIAFIYCPSVFSAMVKGALKITTAFLVFTLFGLVVKGMILLFFPSMRL